MRHLLITVTVLAVMLAASAASAKGPTALRITGPDGAVVEIAGQPGSGEPGSGMQLADLAEDIGMWRAASQVDGERLVAERPAGVLGQRFRIAWTIPGPTGDDTLVQDLYPYAEAGVVTFTRAGQRYAGTTSRQGWHVGPPGLLDTLVDLGLPETPPAARVPAIAIMAMVAVAVVGLAAFVRRRLRTVSGRPGALPAS